MRWFPILPALCFLRLLAAEPAAPAKVSLEDLIRLTQENDLDLAALRGEHTVTLARAREIPYWEDPELRVRYTRIGDSRVPDPYSETITSLERETGRSTLASAGTSTRLSTQTYDDGAGSVEVRETTRTGRDRENETRTRSGSSRETTTRVVTPGRDRVTAVETTRIDTSRTERRSSRQSGSESETERRTTTFGPFVTTETRDGSATDSRRADTTVRESGSVTRTETTERVYERSPYEGGDEYGFQLRLEPRNPWEARQLTRAALAEASLVDLEIRSLEREIAAGVRADYRELQYLRAEITIADDRVKLMRETAADLDAQQQAGGLLSDRPGEARARLLEAEVRLDLLRRSSASILSRLAEAAALADASTIDLARPVPPPALDPAGVDTNLLTQVALENNLALARLATRGALHQANLSAKQAARIPFLAFLAAEYSYRERYGEKERDDYGVYAGVSLPVFSWFDRDLGAGDKAALAVDARQRGIVEARAVSRLLAVLRDLAASNRALADFRQRSPAVRQRIEDEIARIPEDHPDTRRIRFELRRALLDIRAALVTHERSQSETLLALEAELGAGLDRIFTATETAPATPTP